VQFIRQLKKQCGVPRVGWAARLPYSASRGIHSYTDHEWTACGRPPGATQDASHGRRDAHPTQGTLFRFCAALGVCVTLAATVTANGRDILRPGSSSVPSAQGIATGASNGAVATQARTNALDAMARTTRAIQSVQAMQTAARAAAIAGPNNLGVNPNNTMQQLRDVTNGLGPDGLTPAGTAGTDLWQGAKDPVQTTSGGQTTVNIQQTSQQAVLSWNKFNVGKQTTLNFDQSAGGANRNQWIAFNKITDPSGAPSQILGSIKAEGQVYVINQNGIIFGGSSQVNARSLVASSLPINDNLIKQGLLNNPDAQFLFSSLPVPGGSDGTPAFTPDAPPGGKIGDVVVKAGARLNSTQSGDGDGGRVMLVGPNVRNEGTISTPGGQTILAAGNQVGIAAHASNDPSLRGLDVWVGVVDTDAGTVTNSGVIEAFTGSAWMSGRSVNQSGVIHSTTSVNLNGRIDLLATYGAAANPNFDSTFGGGAGGPAFLYQKTGTVTLGAQSVTQILPDYASTKTVPGTTLPQNSKIKIEGLGIHFAEDAIVLAPNADVAIRAGTWPYADADGNRTVLTAAGTADPFLASRFSGTTQKFFFSGGQIFFDRSALLSVAGSTAVDVPLSQSILDVQFRGSELADSPLQRSESLRGISLTVDIRNTGVNNGRYWVGTALGDVTGLAGLIERNVAQFTVKGGTVTMQAGDSIVIQNGATIDVSGGYFQYAGGMVQTSRLLQNGRLVDIKNAQPDQTYDGVYSGTFAVEHSRWGVTRTFASPWLSGLHYEAGYAQGADGGSLNMTAPGMAIDGQLLGLTVLAPRGKGSTPGLSSLSINFAAEKTFAVDANTEVFLPSSPTPPTVTFTRATGQVSVESFTLAGDAPVALPAGRITSVNLSPGLLEEGGFGNLTVVNSDGAVIVPAGTSLAAPTLGSISLTGSNVTIHGNVSARGGALNFTAYNISPAVTAAFSFENPAGALAPAPNADRGLFTLASSAILNTSALVVDDRVTNRAPLSQPLVLDGGSVSITSYSAELAPGTAITVAGGAAVSSRGAVSYGNGGSIAIRTGKDPGFGTVLGGTLSLGSSLIGYSGTKGGSLTVQAGLIQIGGTPHFENTLLLQPDFFRQGGFTSYALEGIGAASSGPEGYAPGITIATGASIQPVAENWLAITNATGSGDVVLRPVLKSVGQRSPASLSFSVLGSGDVFTRERIEVRADLAMESGTQIVTDPGATVAFKGQTLTILGSVEVPAGKITLAGASRFPVPDDEQVNVTFARPTVYLGPEAKLSATGATVLLPDAYQRRTGTLYPGGSITITGNIVASAGAVLDVSGASTTFDVQPTALGNAGAIKVPLNSGLTAPLWKLRTVPVTSASNGGTIDLEGSEMLFTDATLLGAAGGPTAVGGTLSIFSGRFYPQAASRTSADINLAVTQSSATIADTNVHPGIGIAVLDAAGTPLPGMGYFAADRFAQGGFNSLDLGFKFVTRSPLSFGGNVDFQGPVSIAAPGVLRVAAGGVMQADAAVTLSGSYMAVGQLFHAPLNPADQFFPFQQDPAPVTAEYQFAPTFGPGTVAIQAGLIDVGTLSFQNVGRASLVADGGDIRGNGTLQIAGDLTLRAAQIYPTTLSAFSIFAYDHDGTAGSVTITGSGSRATPLSAGGSLNVFASKIVQGGVLRAPFGSITLGWDGTDFDPSDADLDPPSNPVAGITIAVPVTEAITLRAGSITSASGVDASGTALLVPYGLSPDGSSWIDPRGVNITTSGLQEKRITIAGNSVTTEKGSTVDLHGGGDLYAFRWTPGNGGSADLLGAASGEWAAGVEYQSGELVTFGNKTWTARVRNSGQTPTASASWSQVADSYAILPGYASEFAPYATFNTGSNAASLGGDPGYVSSSLQIGDRVYLEATPGLAAGTYTLLPRRYALLPGAFLVTPTTGSTYGTVTLPTGATSVAGYRLNEFKEPQTIPTLRTQFEVASSDVVKTRASYDDYTGTAFFTSAAAQYNVARLQRLPVDAGYLSIQGNASMQLDGSVLANAAASGRGAAIDVSSFADIQIIGGSGAATPGPTVVLNASTLNSWGADSLLIGGLRTRGATETTVAVRTGNLIVDNPGGSFGAGEIILASNALITVAPGFSLAASGHLSEKADAITVSGDGAFIRVSSDAAATFTRKNTTASTAPLMTIGAGARITGAGVTLDSSYGSAFDPAATIAADTLNLGSGQISILLSPAAVLTGSAVPQHLVLDGQFLQDVQQVSALTLRSYRTVDVYGAGPFGSAQLHSVSILGGGMRGYDQGTGTAQFSAAEISLGNPSNVAALTAPAVVTGTLQLDAGTVRLGQNAFATGGWENVIVNAASGVIGDGTGTFSTPGNLTMNTPVITGTRGSTQAVTAGGDLLLQPVAASSIISGGLGAGFTFTGARVVADTAIELPSGQLTLRATGAGQAVEVGGTLNVAGAAQQFYDVIRYSDAGTITLTSDHGDVTLQPGASMSVAANAGGGKAGAITVNAAEGAFTGNDATLLGGATAGETTGSFTLDARTLPSFDGLATALNAGKFFEQRSLRIRTGDVTISNPGGQANVARSFTLSADAGNINVTGTISDGEGRTGGKITLVASGSLTLEPTAILSVRAPEFSDAGKGGEIRLEAGAAVNGVANLGATLDIQGGSQIDLGVDAFVAGPYTDPASSAFKGQFTGKLHLRAPQNAAFDDVLVAPIDGTITGASSILVEGYRVYDLTGFGGTISKAIQTKINNDGISFLGSPGAPASPGYTAMSDRLLANNAGLASQLVLAPGAELINSAAQAPLNFSLNAVNSTVAIANTGGSIVFPNGTPGNDTIRSNTAGTITSATGARSALAANVATAIPAGSSLTLATGGTVTFASGSGGAIAVQLNPGATFTTGASNVTGTVSAVGSSTSLNTITTSFINLAAGTRITFPTGTPGNDRIRTTVAGSLTSLTGTVTNFAANTSIAVPEGSTLNLNAAGRVTFFSGTGGAIPIALAAGSFTTSGPTGVTPATGDLVLGTTADNSTNDWNLAAVRFGPNSAPGVLTMRAAGNLVFNNALSDGFDNPILSGTGQQLWSSQLMNLNAALPINTQSWSYRLTAGGDLTAADFRQTRSLSTVAAGSGSLLLGKFYLPTITSPAGTNATTAQAINNRFQVIRTGTGDIEIAAARDVQLRNQFASIYTAGVRLPDAGTTVYATGDFVEPVVALGASDSPSQGNLGVVQQPYPAQWSMAGGDVTISAGADIRRTTLAAGVVIDDSTAQLPVNWLYRRGLVDANGVFAVGGVDTNGGNDVIDPSASTAWWIDFSNFFQGVGALGGGNIAMSAGRDIINVDAVIPTNARMPGIDPLTGLNIAPDSGKLVELGGGDLSVRTGNNISGGIYYVERGQGTLFASSRITTNQSRSPSLGILASVTNPTILDPLTWLPTTLFLGKGGFDVSARSDILLGPVANPFLLPAGLNNRFWYKTYFNTYSPDSEVDVASFGGSVTHRLAVTLPGRSATPILNVWLDTKNLFQTSGTTSRASNLQPWIRLAETAVTPFATMTTLMPSTLRSTAFAGDVNIVGPLTLFPSETGTLELVASGSIIGLQATGKTTFGTPSRQVTAYSAATINVSDADPSAMPGIASPYGYQTVAGNGQLLLRQTSPSFLTGLDALFKETGSYTGKAATLETRQALHDSSVLHAGDSEPVRLYAGGGTYTGVTLFSPKETRVIAATDITDASFYIQNVSPGDISTVSAGRDFQPYNENSPLRSVASDLSRGNIVADAPRSTVTGVSTRALAGDIQIGGPGVLEVFAGRNLDLGTGANFTDGTGLGINSIGNYRNPSLPFDGADLVILSGVFGSQGTGPAVSLGNSALDFPSFLAAAATADSAYMTKLGPGISFASLTDEQKAIVALERFYAALRDTGRNHPTTGSYATGFAAIDAVFGTLSVQGEIFTRARDIRTSTGGSISIGVPGGGITMASDIFGNPLTPPGIVTEYGGAISAFTHGDVAIGQARIFTLRGGNILIWSSAGDIAAGTAPKTVVTAPPTRVVFDVTSADVKTDLGGLATGGGIGVLAAVAGVKAGDVDLIAPTGVVDAGDAGIRSTGNLNIAATTVLNASNIQVGGSTSGVSSGPAVAAPNIGGLTSASNQGAAQNSTTNDVRGQQRTEQPMTKEEPPSVFDIQILGYGGGDGGTEEERRKKQTPQGGTAAP
jgi:filamentous hemagglutinin